MSNYASIIHYTHREYILFGCIHIRSNILFVLFICLLLFFFFLEMGQKNNQIYRRVNSYKSIRFDKIGGPVTGMFVYTPNCSAYFYILLSETRGRTKKIIIKLEFFDHLPGPITIYYCYGI